MDKHYRVSFMLETEEIFGINVIAENKTKAKEIFKEVVKKVPSYPDYYLGVFQIKVKEEL